MTASLPRPPSLIGRLILWSLALLIASVPLFWVLFSTAVERVSRDVVDTRLLEFADQVRGYWVSVRADGAGNQHNGSGPGSGPGPGKRAGPALRGHAGGADLDWVWQISVSGQVALRSELLMLTNTPLPVKSALGNGGFSLRNIDTSLGRLRVAERVVDEPLPFQQTQAQAKPDERLHYLVGLRLDRYQGYVEDHAARLRGLAWLAVIPIGLALFGLSAVMILTTRRNLAQLSESLHAYASGDAERVEGHFPRELQGVVDRLNTLVSQNEKILERTRKYVSKIAHDINHPLAIIKNAVSGNGDADLMARQIDRMAGLVDRYSSLARAIGPEGQTGQRTNIADMLGDIVDGFSILYRRTPLAFEIQCAAELTFPVPRHDLEAMMSNLVSNAHKYGDSRVCVSAALDDDQALLLVVDDDGPGIPEAEHGAAVNWGKRLDEAPPGTGFGLSIVQDIADLYDGTLGFSESPMGGLQAVIRLPSRG